MQFSPEQWCISWKNCNFESDYIWHFSEFSNFGAFFINKIHVSVQKFIHYCAFKVPNKLNIQAIKFSTSLSLIDGREINFICIPKFLKEKTPKGNKSKRTHDNEEDNNNQNRNKKKPAKENIKKEMRDPQAKIPPNLQFSEVFLQRIPSWSRPTKDA